MLEEQNKSLIKENEEQLNMTIKENQDRLRSVNFIKTKHVRFYYGFRAYISRVKFYLS